MIQDLTTKEDLQILKLKAVFDSFEKNSGGVTVDYIMNHHENRFDSKQDCVKYLIDFKRPPFEYWSDFGSSPSVWRLTSKGRTQLDKLRATRQGSP